MLKFYKTKYSLIRGGKTILSKYGWEYILLNKPPQNYRIALTWNDIEEMELAYVMPKIKHKRKGKMLIYDDWNAYFCIKEWKEPILDLEYSVVYQEVQMSIKDILDYHDSDGALLYLAERGVKYIQHI